MLGYDSRYFSIAAQKGGASRTFSLQTLQFNDTLSVSLSTQYLFFPDRNYTYSHLKNVYKISNDQTEVQQDEQRHHLVEFEVPQFVLQDDANWEFLIPENVTLEVRIERVACNSPNGTCPFMITLVENQPPVLYIMLGVLGGVALFALCGVLCFSMLFCFRDCLSKRNAKKRKLADQENELDMQGFNQVGDFVDNDDEKSRQLEEGYVRRNTTSVDATGGQEGSVAPPSRVMSMPYFDATSMSSSPTVQQQNNFFMDLPSSSNFSSNSGIPFGGMLSDGNAPVGGGQEGSSYPQQTSTMGGQQSQQLFSRSPSGRSGIVHNSSSFGGFSS